MLGIIIFIHVAVCILLIGIILIQRGRGSGLVEGLSDLDSVFGTKTNTFMSRSTTVLSTLFLLTCLILAVISARQSRSLMERVKPQQSQAQPQTQPHTSPAVEPETETQTQPPQPQENKTE